MKKTKRRNLRKRNIKNRCGRKTRRGGMLGKLKPLGKSAITVGKKIATATADIALEVGKNQTQQDIISRKGPLSQYNKQIDFMENKENIYKQMAKKYQTKENVNPNIIYRNTTIVT